MGLLKVKLVGSPTEPADNKSSEPAGDKSNEEAPGDTITTVDDSPPPVEAGTDPNPPKEETSEASDPVKEPVEHPSADNEQKQAEFPPIDPAAGSELNAAEKEADAANEDVSLMILSIIFHHVHFVNGISDRHLRIRCL